MMGRLPELNKISGRGSINLFRGADQILYFRSFFLCLAMFSWPNMLLAQTAEAECQASAEVLYKNHIPSKIVTTNYSTWISKKCQNYREDRNIKYDSLIVPKIELIVDKGYDWKEFRPQESFVCKRKVDRVWAASSRGFKRRQRKSELQASCLANAKAAYIAKSGDIVFKNDAETIATISAEHRKRTEQLELAKSVFISAKNTHQSACENWIETNLDLAREPMICPDSNTEIGYPPSRTEEHYQAKLAEHNRTIKPLLEAISRHRKACANWGAMHGISATEVRRRCLLTKP